jgi:Na+/H+ antiporter NhaD/arsenite permease-like protein
MRWVILALFALTYIGISARRVHWVPIGRPSVALVGACALVVAGVFAGPIGLAPEEALGSVEPHTLVLLFGMMVVAAGLGTAGFFDWATALAARTVRSRAALLWLVTAGAGLLSAVLVNDAVCLLATPLVVRVARQTRTALAPLMFAVAMGSNAGSALTLSGNPQNMLVAQLSGLHYREYLAAAALPALAALALTAALLHLIFRRALADPAPEPPEEAVPVRLDRGMLIASGVALAGVVVANVAGASLAWSALVGASVVLLAARDGAARVLEKVDWSVIVFFASLFVVVAALQKTGLPAEWLAEVGAGRSLLALVLVLSVGSQVVSNVPLILLLEPWIRTFPDQAHAWTVTAIVTTLAGNLTLVGSVANIIVMEQSRAHIGFWAYLRVGVPVTVVSTAAAVGLHALLWR